MFDSPYISLVVSWLVAILLHTGLARRLTMLRDRAKQLHEECNKKHGELQTICDAAGDIRRGLSSNQSQINGLRSEIYTMVSEIKALSPRDESVRGVLEQLSSETDWEGNVEADGESGMDMDVEGSADKVGQTQSSPETDWEGDVEADGESGTDMDVEGSADEVGQTQSLSALSSG